MAIEASEEEVEQAFNELEAEADKELGGDAGADDQDDDDLEDAGDADDGGDDADDEDADDADEDLDDDEDLDEVDDEEDDPARSDAAAETLPEGYSRDKNGVVHRKDGTIASKEELAKLTKAPAGEKKPDTASTATGKPAAEGATADASQAAGPKWEPLKIKADKQEHAIAEVFGVQQHKGFKVLAVADEKWNDFTRRIGMGIVGARMARELDAEKRAVEQIKKDLAERAENPEPTDAEVQAQVYLEALQGKGPYAAWFQDGEETPLKRAFEPWQLEILSRDAKIALVERKKEFETKRTERKATEEQATAEEAEYTEGLSLAIDQIAQEHEDWDKLDLAEFKEIFADLGPLARSILGKKDGNLFITEHGERVIRRALAGAAAGRKAAPATSTETEPDAATAGDKHDRFNDAVNSGKAPPSTSVKDGRRDARDRSDRGNRDRGRNRRRRDKRTPEQRAEDATRRLEREWLKSTSLELPD